ncbi:hypothetical protein JCM5350_007387 [Sporobolomyces pararoseus]
MAGIDPRMLMQGGAGETTTSNRSRDEQQLHASSSTDSTSSDSEGSGSSTQDDGEDMPQDTFVVEKIKNYAPFERAGMEGPTESWPIEEDRYEVRYLVKWEGYEDESEDTWEPKSNFSSEEVWRNFLLACERTRPRELPSHDEVVEEVRKMNRKEVKRRKKQLEEEEKKKKLLAESKPTSSSSKKSSKKKRDSRADSPASVSTTSSRKSRTSQATVSTSHSKSATSNMSNHKLSSVEIRRLRGQSINQEAINEMMAASGSKALQELRLTPPPPPKAQRQSQSKSKNVRDSEGSFAKNDRGGKGKGKEVARDDGEVQNQQQATAHQPNVQQRGFARESSASEEEEEATQRPSTSHQPVAPTSCLPPTAPAPSRGFADEDEEEEDMPMEDTRQPNQQPLLPVTSTPHAQQPFPPSQSLPIHSIPAERPSRPGFAQSDSEEEEQAARQESPRDIKPVVEPSPPPPPTISHQSGPPSRPLRFASDSGDDEDQPAPVRPTYGDSDPPTLASQIQPPSASLPSHPTTRGFALESSDEEEAPGLLRSSQAPQSQPHPQTQAQTSASTIANAAADKSGGFADDSDDDQHEQDATMTVTQSSQVNPTQSSLSTSLPESAPRGFADDSNDEDEEQGQLDAQEPSKGLDVDPIHQSKTLPESTSSAITSTSRRFASESADEEEPGQLETEEGAHVPKEVSNGGNDSGFGGSSKTSGFAVESEDEVEGGNVAETSTTVVSGMDIERSEGATVIQQNDGTGSRKRTWADESDSEGEGVQTVEQEKGREAQGSTAGQEVEKGMKGEEQKNKKARKDDEKRKSGDQVKMQSQSKGENKGNDNKAQPFQSSSTTSKRSSIDGGRQSPPLAKKKKRKNIVVDDEEEEEGVSSSPAVKADVLQSKSSNAQRDALKKLKIGRVSKDGNGKRNSSGGQRSPSVVTNSATDQHSNSHGSGNNKKYEEDPFNYGKQKTTSKNGYVLLNAGVLQFKKLPEAIAGKENPNWPVGALDHERIRWWWKIGKNPLVNFCNFDRVLSHREVYVTPPPTARETGVSKRAAAHEKDYLALQLVLANVEGVKQADSLRSEVTAIFVHASLANELGRFPGKLSELDRLRDRDDVLCFFYGTGDDKQRALRQFWKPLTAITFTPSALIEDPHRLGQLIETASASSNEFDGTRNQFPFMLPQYLLAGGALGSAVDKNDKPVSRPPSETAQLRPARATIFSLVQRKLLPLTKVLPSVEESRVDQTWFPSLPDRTPGDLAVLMKLSQCYKPRFCQVSTERLQKLVCTWRSQYASVRRWIIVATEEEISSLGPAPGVVLATIDRAEELLEQPLASAVG